VVAIAAFLNEFNDVRIAKKAAKKKGVKYVSVFSVPDILWTVLSSVTTIIILLLC